MFSHGLADEGARVVVADLAEDAAQQLAVALAVTGHECLALCVDVSDVTSTTALASKVLERFGRIDILVNCAALYATLARKQFLEIEPEEWNRVMQIDLTGCQLCIRAVLPQMKEQQAGVIVNMGSVNTYLAPAGRAHYNAAKAAVESLSKTLARELGPFGIRVNSLCPGLVKTGKAPLVSEERYEHTASERALRRDLLPEDLVGPLVFLCSDEASMVTGHALVVDGGQIFV